LPIIIIDAGGNAFLLGKDCLALAEALQPGTEDLVGHGGPVPAHQGTVDAQAFHRVLTQVQSLPGDRSLCATRRLGALTPSRTSGLTILHPAD
jgi:hypothetical protein